MDLPAAIPLVIGVTGHRDLVEDEAPAIRERVREYLSGLRARWPNTPLIVASQLAEGADLLVAEEAHALGLELVFLLPLPLADYRAQFSGEAAQARFDALRAVARVVDLATVESPMIAMRYMRSPEIFWRVTASSCSRCGTASRRRASAAPPR